MNDNLNTISKLLDDFNSFIENRSNIFLVIFDEVFPKILEWHFSIWKKEYELLVKEDQIREWAVYSELSRSLDSIFKKIEERSLKEDNSFSFFSNLKKHLEKYQQEVVDGKDNKKFYYVSSIIPIFFSSFVENIREAAKRFDIWEHYFPDEWKITKENIEKPDNFVSRELLNNFLTWAQSRLWRTEEDKYDDVLEEMSSNLFPSVDPILWARILTLVFSPWTDNNRMLSLVTKGTNFGYKGRVFAGFVSAENDMMRTWEQQIKSQEEQTLKLALYLFGDFLTKGTLEKFIKDLDKLKFEEESSEEVRRKQYIRILENMIHIIEST